MSWVRVHRACAIALVVPLVVWSITGLLFHLKPGWSRAYDQLDVARAPQLELVDTALGPLWRTRDALIDTTGRVRSPLSIDDAKTLALDAISRSRHRTAYGELRGATIVGDAVRVELDGATVEINRTDARISQRGADTDRIDWLYRVHYLQWTGNATIDRALAVLGLALIWLVFVPGIVLFVRRRSR
jgi:hypothetical protein